MDDPHARAVRILSAEARLEDKAAPKCRSDGQVRARRYKRRGAAVARDQETPREFEREAARVMGLGSWLCPIVTVRGHTFFPRPLAAPGCTVVDLGANRGDFAREVSTR